MPLKLIHPLAVKKEYGSQCVLSHQKIGCHSRHKNSIFTDASYRKRSILTATT